MKQHHNNEEFDEDKVKTWKLFKVPFEYAGRGPLDENEYIELKVVWKEENNRSNHENMITDTKKPNFFGNDYKTVYAVKYGNHKNNITPNRLNETYGLIAEGKKKLKSLDKKIDAQKIKLINLDQIGRAHV